MSLLESFIDNVFRDKVPEPKIGSLVYCDIVTGYAEHSGIYVGKRRIVHLNGDGLIESVSPQEFIGRLSGFNTAMSIYVSCYETKAVGSYIVADRARIAVGKKRDYSLIFDNCHQFSAGCLAGDFDNSCNFMWMLKDESKKHLNSNSWRIWDIDLFK
ncbi:MAG: lecithin retinol acyltransferase family protein [Methylococcales bacterium]|nr:lecithin retinol acyltransferase family protein [Methylococcales bacterium]